MADAPKDYPVAPPQHAHITVLAGQVVAHPHLTLYDVGGEGTDETCRVLARSLCDAFAFARDLWPDADPWIAREVSGG
jgi:hypothetical protein